MGLLVDKAKMPELIGSALSVANNIDDCAKILLPLLRQVRSEGNDRLGYVVGPVTSMGPDRISANRVNLVEITKRLRDRINMPIFCAPEVFTDELEKRVPDENAPRIKFWEEVVLSWQLTDMFMLPNWSLSNGAKNERLLAFDAAMHIHYLDWCANIIRSNISPRDRMEWVRRKASTVSNK